jgi:transposase
MKEYSAIGLDVSDKTVEVAALDAKGDVVWQTTVTCTPVAIRRAFRDVARSLVVLETGMHTGWLARLLSELGQEVVVANARKVRAIWGDERKSDERDAEMLARLARSDRRLLRPVTIRSAETQRTMDVVTGRDALVRSRTQMVNVVRSLVKNRGARLRRCSPRSLPQHCRTDFPDTELVEVDPLLATIEALNAQIVVYDRLIEAVAKERYQEATERMSQITGVGTLTALVFTLVIEDPQRFVCRRTVGAYLGLTPRRDQSGETDKQLPITHAGHSMLRRLLVTAAQYVMGPFGPDCELRRFGERLARRGGKNAKKRAVVAVARKLAVVMLTLWHSGESYRPLRQVA